MHKFWDAVSIQFWIWWCFYIWHTPTTSCLKLSFWLAQHRCSLELSSAIGFDLLLPYPTFPWTCMYLDIALSLSAKCSRTILKISGGCVSSMLWMCPWFPSIIVSTGNRSTLSKTFLRCNHPIWSVTSCACGVAGISTILWSIFGTESKSC